MYFVLNTFHDRSSFHRFWTAFIAVLVFSGHAVAQSTRPGNEIQLPASNGLITDPVGSVSGENNGLGQFALENLYNPNDAAFHETDFAGQHLNFNEFPREFNKGLSVRNGPWAIKFGGYVKADLIHDFRAIDSTDTFDPVTIPIGEPQRTNTQFHSRQTRLSMDTRWNTDTGVPLRIMAEGDFFGDGNTFRLRHAYGEYGNWIIGQTWSTFAHRAALPNTLDVVGDVASVGRRQTQVRWSHTLPDDRWKFAAAIEDSNVTVEDPILSFGQPRIPSPNLIVRLRYTSDTAQYQIAAVGRRLGFQPTGSAVQTFNGAGLNATGLVNISEHDRFYGGLLWGYGIGNYRDLPDLAPTAPGQGIALESLAWYVGMHHQWSTRWFSNLTYSEGEVNNTPLQFPTSIRQSKYFATNLIWQPTPHTFSGVEWLWGLRGNLDFTEQDASRVMASFGFLLP